MFSNYRKGEIGQFPVVVVIPVYKQSLSESEQTSLRACIRILYSHPIVYVCPEDLSLDRYTIILPADVIRFDRQNFRSLQDYSRLMKSYEFYGAFSKYEYMLIYQLDCYVFRDELLEWCQKGFSYIGGPWISYDYLQSWKFRALPFLKNLLAKVGGGGFSLRKVEQHYQLAKKYQRYSPLYNMMEDQFWCSIVSRLEREYRLPDVSTALKFCFDRDPENAYELAGKRLPFGCHAWSWPDNYNKFWREYIPLEGQ